MKYLVLSRNPSTPLRNKAKGPEVPNQGQILKGHLLNMRMMSVGVGCVSTSQGSGLERYSKKLKCILSVKGLLKHD